MNNIYMLLGKLQILSIFLYVVSTLLLVIAMLFMDKRKHYYIFAKRKNRLEKIIDVLKVIVMVSFIVMTIISITSMIIKGMYGDELVEDLFKYRTSWRWNLKE